MPGLAELRVPNDLRYIYALKVLYAGSVFTLTRTKRGSSGTRSVC
jgi:hypothetical protein